MSEDNAPRVVKLNPEPEEYEEAETAFLRAVGLCITQWAFIDRMLFRLFKQGIGAPTHRAAIILMTSTPLTLTCDRSMRC